MTCLVASSAVVNEEECALFNFAHSSSVARGGNNRSSFSPHSLPFSRYDSLYHVAARLCGGPGPETHVYN